MLKAGSERECMSRRKWGGWKSIHAVKLPEPVIYVYTIPGADGCFLLSERGIREKSVEELQELYFNTVKTRLQWRGKLEDKRNSGFLLSHSNLIGKEQII